jgi:hypothetical protein
MLTYLLFAWVAFVQFVTRFGDCASYYPGVVSCDEDQWPNETALLAAGGAKSFDVSGWIHDNDCNRHNHAFCANDTGTETIDHCYTGTGEDYRGENSVTES